MIDLTNIKTILRFAGVNSMMIKFDKEKEIVTIWYVFKSEPGKKEITYQEIEKLLSIGHPGPAVSAGPAPVPESDQLHGEN